MKKFVFILFLFGFLLGSCSDLSDAPVPEEPTGKVKVSLSSRSEQDAIKIALDACNRMYGNDVKSRGIEGLKVIKTYAKNGKSRSQGSCELYIVNFPDSAGYAIVPTSTQLPELVALTESGSIASIDEIEVPMAKYFIYDALTPNATIRDTNKVIISQQIYEYDTVANYIVAPKASWNWSQHGFESQFFRNGMVGCTNLAASMVLAYFEYPKSLNLTFNGTEYNTRKRDLVTFNWPLIKTHKYNPDRKQTHSNCVAVTETHQELAEICAELAYRSGATPVEITIDNKTMNATSTFFDNSISQLQKILSNRQCTYRTLIDSMIGAYLTRGIIMMSGTDYTNKIGHTWIVDGCQWIEYWERTYIKTTLTGPGKLVDERYCTYSYLHFNWGFGGMDNGYFYVKSENPTFNPNKDGTEKEGESIEIENYNFKFEKYAVFI